MKLTNVYALLEVRNIGGPAATVDLYKVCPTMEGCMAVYRELFGEPRSVVEKRTDAGDISWWINEDSTGATTISRYVIEGELEESQG